MKYRITENRLRDSLNFGNRNLYQIQAVIDFGIVKAGELGGYIEKESNLSQWNNAWIFGIAKVFDDAYVEGEAQIHDNSMVNQNAIVSGSAKLFGNSHINGFAIVDDNAQIYGSAKVSERSAVGENAILKGYSRVCGDAIVKGDAELVNSWIGGNARLQSGKIINTTVTSIQGSQYTVNFDGDLKHLMIGCERRTIEDWKQNYEGLGLLHHFSEGQILEYKRYIDHAELLLKYQRMANVI